MARRKKVFSDSWDRVAQRHASLLPGVSCQTQFYRGQRWRVLRAPYENEYFRLTGEAWGFVGRLTRDKTIDEVWQEAMERDPEGAPGQEEALEIIGQLSNAGLIVSDFPADSREMFLARARERRKLIGKQALNFLFLRVPIFNPDRLLSSLRPFGALLCHPLTFILWAAVMLWGIKSVIENWSGVRDQATGFLTLENLPWILVCTVFLKVMHEFGHGLTCKHFGGYVPTFGIMFILLAPLPFVDATASWGFRERYRRIFVSSAGMYVELFIAAIAAIVWAYTGDTQVSALAYNVMLIGSVTTLLFNLNPLLKFDGYYILVDVLGIANLQQRSVNYLRYLLERFGFGRDEADNPAEGAGEAFWLFLYGIFAGLYRIFLMLSIALIVGQEFFALGIALAVFTIAIYLVLPVLKFFRWVTTAPELAMCRSRACLVVGLAVAALFVGLGVVPFAEHYQEPGIVRPIRQMNVSAGTSGELAEIVTPPGAVVEPGTVLLRLANPFHEHDVAASLATLARLEIQTEQVTLQSPASRASYERLLEIEREKLARALRQEEDLWVRAPIAGVWVAPQLDEDGGAWFAKGQVIGQVRDPSVHEFLAVVSQREAAHLFSVEAPQPLGVRLRGDVGRVLPISTLRVVPGEQWMLPSAALGWMGGGSVQVATDDPEGLRASEGFYLVRGILEEGPEHERAILADRTGEIRFYVGHRPLALQLWHKVRQLVQRRLRI